MTPENYQDDLSMFFEAQLAMILKPAIRSIEEMMVKYTDSVILDLPTAVEIRMTAAILLFKELDTIERLAGLRPGEEVS